MRFNRSKFFSAISKNNFDYIKSEILNGIDINISLQKSNEYTPIQEAAYRNNYEICNYLLQKGAEVKPKYKLLERAVFNSNLALLILFLNNKNSYNQDNLNYALLEASKRNNFEIVKNLIDFGANPDYNDDSGYSCLHGAARYSSIVIVKYLCEHGASINKRYGNISPIMYAVINNQYDSLEYLFKRGADLTGIEKNNGFYTSFIGGSHEMSDFYHKLICNSNFNKK